MSPSEVLEALKTSVKVNASHIDKVFIVLSGRIEKGHEDAIKEIFKWLKLHKYDENVVMVYTKCENMTLIEKQKAMASKFQCLIKMKRGGTIMDGKFGRDSTFC